MPVPQGPLSDRGLPSLRILWIGLMILGMTGGAHSATNSQLVRMVRQDCGSCHGMQLTGGLGPALTPTALKDKPMEALVATIIHGRPGTPMPGWSAMLSEDDARWIAQQLLIGFPHE